MERERESRSEWIYRLCVLSIGIPNDRGGILIEQPIDGNESIVPAEPDGPIPIEITYYRNSIEEYRYLLSLSNRTGSRTGLSKKKRLAESGIKFLQYARSDERFMEFLIKEDEITYNRVIIYSNPSILKTPFRSKKIPADKRTPVDQSSR